MTARFTPAVIGELRSRVVSHNETAAKVLGTPTVKLGQMRALYKRWYGGKAPHEHALKMIDQHLAQMVGEALEKARRPFEEGRHPRGRRGQFRPSGEQSSGGQRRFYGDVASRDDHRALRDENAGYQAFQTQVIPETRYSVFGPPIAGAAGIALGAASGATAGFHGTPLDRVATRALRWTGGKVGGAAARGTAAAAVKAPVGLARAGIGAINRTLGTSIRRPVASGPAATAVIARAQRGGTRIGRAAGGVVGHGSAMLFAAPAAGARRVTEAVVGHGFGGRLAGRGVGALFGAAVPGLLYAGSLAHLQSVIGPFEDTMFPRRVKKIAGPLLDAPEVLAKQIALLSDDDLAKANFSGIARRIIATLRPAIPQISGAASSLRHYGPPTGPEAAFQAFAGPVRVGPHVASRAAVVAGHAVGIAGAGAAVGAISGAALGAFNEKHPRDPHGRFARKTKGAITGAKVGAVVGAGLGVGLGLIAARRGHAELLNQALARLRGQSEVDGTNLPAAMYTRARETARSAHALAFREANAKTIPPFPPGSVTNPADHVAGHLRANAIAAFREGEGAAMGNVHAWYRWQLDRAFDKVVGRQLRAHGALPTKDGGRSSENLIDRVDPDRLNANQRKLWDDAIGRRQKTLDEIKGIYDERAATAREMVGELTTLQTEKEALSRSIKTLPERWDDIKNDASLDELRRFARSHLDYEVKASGRGAREAAVKEIDDRFLAWPAEANERLGAIEERAAELEPFADTARNHQSADLSQTELQAIPNPFRTSRRDQFFRNRPAGANTLEGMGRIQTAVGDAAVEPFRRVSTAAGEAAEAQLSTIIAAHEASLVARLPKTGIAMSAFQRVAPVLAGHLQQGVKDYVELTTAARVNLTGRQKAIYDWLHANENPRQAWQTTKSLAISAQTQATKVGRFALRNWKTISTVVGPLTAMGAIDLSQPGLKKKIRINPRTWRTPRDIGIVTEWPDPIRKPNEALFGISYRDRQNQEKFLSGIHITSKDGAHNQLPFGADVNQVRNILRGGNNNKTPSAPIKMDDPKARQQAEQVQRENHIKQAGPEGFEYGQREGGNADLAQEAARKEIYDRHIQFFDTQKIPPGNSTNNKGRYFTSLRDLFEAPGSEVMDRATRAGLLTGTRDRRGIFANRDKVYQSGDKEKITVELIRQIHAQGDRLVPTNPDDGPHDEYTQLKRALSLVADHLGLGGSQKQRVIDHLDQSFRKITGREPPETADAAAPAPLRPGASDGASFDTFFTQLQREVPDDMLPDLYRSKPDEFRDDVHAQYTHALNRYRKQNAQATDAEAHKHAASSVNDWVNKEFSKIAPIAGMAKLDLAPPRPGLPRAPRIQAPAAPRPITGAATSALPRPAAPKPPASGSVAGDLRNAVRPAHALSQAGSYGLSQLGYDAMKNIAMHLVPGGGRLGWAARGAAGLAGGIAGSLGGQHAGEAAGRKLGDRSPPPRNGVDQLVGNVGGSAGQIAFDHFAGHAAARGAVAVGARVLGGVAGTTLDPFIGPLGTALGAAAAGALADEGVALLYRHLSRYGAHVPKMAAAGLGHKGGKPSAIAGRAAA